MKAQSGARHTVSKLIGSPPGYVGYDEVGPAWIHASKDCPGCGPNLFGVLSNRYLKPDQIIPLLSEFQSTVCRQATIATSLALSLSLYRSLILSLCRSFSFSLTPHQPSLVCVPHVTFCAA